MLLSRLARLRAARRSQPQPIDVSAKEQWLATLRRFARTCENRPLNPTGVEWTGCGSRMSPRRLGKIMIGGPVRSTGAPTQRMTPEHKQLTLALLLSLLIHTWVMSLALGGWRVWLPGFGLPWERP